MNRRSVISNLIWKYAEKCGAQLVSVVVAIVLARILNPKEYGVVAIVTVFINILGVFIDSGLASALIQKKDIINYICDSLGILSNDNKICDVLELIENPTQIPEEIIKSSKCFLGLIRQYSRRSGKRIFFSWVFDCGPRVLFCIIQRIPNAIFLFGTMPFIFPCCKSISTHQQHQGC